MRAPEFHSLRRWMRGLCRAALVALSGFAMVSGAKAADTTGAKKGDSSASTEARTLPSKPTWGAYYGAASNVDIGRLGSTFNVVVIDADPGEGDDAPAFDAAQIAALKARGAKVLSYLNFGACEESRSWWSDVPAGFVSCRANRAARLGRYQGYPEYWMNPGNAQFQHLIVDYIAPRLVAAGVDGFMLDNFEVVSHGAGTADGQCDAACRQGGLDLVATLRKRYPDRSIVLNNASTAVLPGSSGGGARSPLLGGAVAPEGLPPSAG